jgi:3,4-dihydroxy 2-butanone 4-phosphate synthase/GTP cyclohydrolase II
MRQLGLLVVAESASDGSQYGISVDLAGHDRPDSMEDRATSARALASASTRPTDLTSPGHLVPVRAAEGGVLASPHVPEAVLDLARRAGGGDVGVFNQLAEQTPLAGAASDPAARKRLSGELGIAVLTIRELITEHERGAGAVRRITSVELPTRTGFVQAVGYRGLRTPSEDIIAVVEGDPRGRDTRVHVHLRCPVSDVFGGLACECGEQLARARVEIARAGNGVILYSSWGSGRSLGHFHDEFADATTAGIRPRREREIAAVLRDLGIGAARLSSNEPLDAGFLSALGIHLTRG